METFGLNRHFYTLLYGFLFVEQKNLGCSSSSSLSPSPISAGCWPDGDVTGHLHTRDTLSLCHVMWRTCYVTANVHIPNITIPGSLLAAWLKLSPPPPLRCVSPEPSAASGSWGCCYQLVKFFVFTSPHRYNNTAGEKWNGDTGFTFTAT